MRTATIWRECAHCGTEFSQPDDPGRKRRYCTDACKQAAYRARKRASQERTRRAHEEYARRQRRYEEHRRQERAREEARRQRQHAHQPPPHSSNGHRTDTAAQARARRIIEALLRKAASTNYPHEAAACPHEAAACRAKAEELRRKHGL